jgi:hypothetical protein
MGSYLKAGTSGGSSLMNTSCTISARVLTLNVPDRMMTIGMIFTSAFRVPWVWMASMRGS